MFTNLTKAEVIDKMNWLRERSNQFEDEKQEEETLAIGIAWIGHKLLADYEPHKRILAMHGVSLPATSPDDTDFYPQYELTIFGQPICLNEYATSIATGPSTHVLLIDDEEADMNHQLQSYHVPDNSTFHELILDCRDARQRTTFCPRTSID